MKTARHYGIGLLLLLLCSPSWGAEVVTLANGLRILTETRNDTPLVAIQMWVRAGSREEQQGEEGSAHFVEHLVFKGTTTRKTGETDLELEQLGGVWKAATGPDYARYETRITQEALENTLALLADFLRNATLPAGEMEKERPVILDELAQHRTQNQNLLLDLFYLAFAPTAYRHSPGGTPDAILSLKRDTLLNFYRRNYAPANCTLVLVGNIEPKQAIAFAAKRFGDWKPASATLPAMPTFPLVASRYFDVAGQTETESLALGYLIPAQPDASQSLPTQWVKQMLQTRLRAKIAPLEAIFQYTPRLGSNFMLITAHARTSRELEVLSQLKSLVLAECEGLVKRPPTKLEIEIARSHLQTEEALERETSLGVASQIGYSALLQIAPQKPETRPTPQDIQKFVQDYLTPEQLFALHLLAKGQQP